MNRTPEQKAKEAADFKIFMETEDARLEAIWKNSMCYTGPDAKPGQLLGVFR
jgi:hypothetical protein